MLEMMSFQELLPLILCTAIHHPEEKERDKLLHALVNLIKRPDAEHRYSADLFRCLHLIDLIPFCPNPDLILSLSSPVIGLILI